MAKFSLILFSLSIFILITKIASYAGPLSQCWELGLENGKVGIKLEERVVKITCNENAIWFDKLATWCVKQRGSIPVPFCIRHGCPSLTPPRHGELAYHYRLRKVRVTCDPGYTLTGPDAIACNSRVWNATVPACQELRCPSLTPPRHGDLAYEHNQTVVRVTCDPGYTLKGHHTIACNSGVWNATVPACQATYTSPPEACTFETDTCGWRNSPDNHFIWDLKSAALLHPSDQNNSPVTDHTLRTATGKFMIASAAPEGTSDGERKRATLYSPVFKTARGGVACFNFFYHIYGKRGTGELRVYFKPQNKRIEFVAPVFETSSPSHASWIRQRLVFTNVTQPFQIVIESEEGGVVAIDDVMVNYDILCIIPTCSL